jgi:hypothetical protein
MMKQGYRLQATGYSKKSMAQHHQKLWNFWIVVFQGFEVAVICYWRC